MHVEDWSEMAQSLLSLFLAPSQREREKHEEISRHNKDGLVRLATHQSFPLHASSDDCTVCRRKRGVRQLWDDLSHPWPKIVICLLVASISAAIWQDAADYRVGRLGQKFYAYESSDTAVNPGATPLNVSLLNKPPYWADPMTWADKNVSGHSFLSKNVFNPTAFAVQENKVPPILHYVYLYENPNRTLPFLQSVGMKSAVLAIKPKKVMIWHLAGLPPQGWWWQQFQRAAEEQHSEIQLMPTRNVTQIFGRNVTQVHHKADVVRLEALIEHGGVYLDMDNFLMRDFRPLMQHGVLMGQEANPDHFNSTPTGIANGIIVSPPRSSFLTRWYNQYAYFNHTKWNDHSVRLPWKLARQYPEEITILNSFAFFWPLWLPAHVRVIHKKDWYDFDRSYQFVYQGWAAVAHKHLDRADPVRIWQHETSFNRLIRRWVPQTLRDQWVLAGRPA